MLRTTISKIRRVCTVAFLPRALRATRKPSGKFEKFSYAAVYKVQIRSKSDARDHDDKRPVAKRIIEFAFASNKPPRKRINRIDDRDEQTAINRKDSASRVQMSGETECEKCERLIAKVFGVDQGKPERDQVRENANLEEVRLQATRKDEETDPDIDSTDPEKRANIGRRRGAVETLHTPSKILENIAQVNLANNKNTELSENKRIKDTEVHSSEVYDAKDETNKDIEVVTLRATTAKEDEEKIAQKVEQIGETPVVEAKTPVIEGFNVTPRALEQNATLNFSDTTEKSNLSTENVEGEKLDELASRCINAPDDKIDERLLKEMESLKTSQPDQTAENPMYEEDVAKMEMVKEERNVIEQTNMDYEEREEKKPADFNILQRLYPTFDGLLSEKDVKQEDTSPTLFKPERMYTQEKMIYYEEPTVGFEGSEQLKDNIESNEPVNARFESNEPLKGDLETSEQLEVSVDSNEPGKVGFEGSEPEKVGFEGSISEKVGFEGSEREKVNFTSSEPLKDEHLDKDIASDRPKVYPHQVLIDPYDKSTLADEHEETDRANTYEHVTVKEGPAEPIRVIQEMDKEDKKVSEEEPRKEVFDPKYVVTCNETCPISAEGLTTTALNAKTGCLKGTEAIYDDLASSNLKKHAFKQVAVENKTENNIAESKEEDEAIELKAKPIIETAGAKNVEKESSNNPEEELMEEKEETVVEHQEETKPKEEISDSYPQPDYTLNPLHKINLNEEDSTATLEKDFRVAEPIQRNIAANCTIPLPKLNDDEASLSELLKRVRQRNRIEYCRAVDLGSTAVEHLGSQAAVVEPEIGKCGKKPPPCPPPAPKCPPPDPCKPPPCPPPQPPCPKPACPPAKPPCPPKKSPCAKFSKCTGYGIPNIMSVFFSPKIYPQLPIPVTISDINGEIIDDTVLNAINIKSKLTQEIITKFHNLNEVLCCDIQVRKLEATESCNFQKTTQRERIAVKDFEPWTPIPSWPIPQKELKRPFVCPKEGCKLVPPPKLNPPCQLNPCINFPKRTFSLAEFLMLHITKYKLCSHE